jgi:hypothetical protein
MALLRLRMMLGVPFPEAEEVMARRSFSSAAPSSSSSSSSSLDEDDGTEDE